MWIFSITPNWLYHTLFFASLIAILAGVFLAKNPLVSPYSLMLKWGGLAAVVISIFLEGALYDYNVMQARIDEVKKQVEIAELATKEANDKLAVKSDKIKEKIKLKREYITRYIDREVTKYNNQCVIPDVFIKAHNLSLIHI